MVICGSECAHCDRTVGGLSAVVKEKFWMMSVAWCLHVQVAHYAIRQGSKPQFGTTFLNFTRTATLQRGLEVAFRQ